MKVDVVEAGGPDIQRRPSHAVTRDDLSKKNQRSVLRNWPVNQLFLRVCLRAGAIDTLIKWRV